MKLFGLLLAGGAVFASLTAPVASFAKAPQHAVRMAHEFRLPKNLLADAGAWKTTGNVTIDDGVVTLAEQRGEDEAAYKDVNVSGHDGEIAVFAAYTKAERVTKDDVTGLPVVYGYALDANGKVIGYFQNPQMTHRGKAGKWALTGGGFVIPKGTKTIRYFVQQAETSDSAKQGDDAMFRGMRLSLVKNRAAGLDMLAHLARNLHMAKAVSK